MTIINDIYQSIIEFESQHIDRPGKITLGPWEARAVAQQVVGLAKDKNGTPLRFEAYQSMRRGGAKLFGIPLEVVCRRGIFLIA